MTVTEDAVTHKWYVSQKRQNIVTVHEDGAGSGRSCKQELPISGNECVKTECMSAQNSDIESQ